MLLIKTAREGRGQVKFYPYKKKRGGGGRKGFRHAEEGHKKFTVSCFGYAICY